MTIREIMSTPVGKKLLVYGTPKVTLSIARTPRSYLNGDPDGTYFIYGEDVIGTVRDWTDPIVIDCPSELITINNLHEVFFHANLICVGTHAKYSTCLDDLQLASIITSPKTVGEKYLCWGHSLSTFFIDVYDTNGAFQANMSKGEDIEKKLQKMNERYTKFTTIDRSNDDTKISLYV